MGEYVININWGGGRSGGGRGNTTTPSFLMNPAAATEAATTATTVAAAIPAAANQIPTTPAALATAFTTFSQFTDNKYKNQKQNIPLTPIDFFSFNRNFLPMVSRDGEKNIRNDNARNKDNDTENTITYYKRIYLYASAQALRLVNTIASTKYQYASAIASSTAELQAVNEYENIMAGFG